jgi:hypothetical protein
MLTQWWNYPEKRYQTPGYDNGSMTMKPQRIFITYLLGLPMFMVFSFVLLLSSWTIERIQLKKVVPTGKKS